VGDIIEIDHFGVKGDICINAVTRNLYNLGHQCP
jgi:hypothetical protein